MKSLIKKILKKLPHEYAEYAVRDISFLTCTIFTETHLTSFKKIFKFNGFSINFWFGRQDGNVIFYRSGLEYNKLGGKIGKKFLKNPQDAKKVSGALIEMADEINEFIKANKKLNDLLNQWRYFYALYRDFFAYHQAVYWASEYLLKSKNLKEKKKIKKIIKILDKAYKYNERIVPNVEKYFLNLKIGDLSREEINGKIIKAPKKRSILLLDGKIKIFSFSEAKVIDASIREDYKKYLKKFKTIQGIAVGGGVVRGRIKLITDLSKLKESRKGDILVTTQTRPQYNDTLKNLKAIITDEGGMLSHASILAREFGIPCVVGTKIATKTLKDGDLVEVDADKGLVKILK